MTSAHQTGLTYAAPAWRMTALLIAGDVLAFLAFSALGRSSHGESAGLDAILQVVYTAAPFAIAWFVIAPISGAYRAEVIINLRRMLGRVAIAWLVAWPIGLILRALILERGIPLSFALVTLLTNMAILLIWRGTFTWLAGRIK